jgi:hypothetical protein
VEKFSPFWSRVNFYRPFADRDEPANSDKENTIRAGVLIGRVGGGGIAVI